MIQITIDEKDLEAVFFNLKNIKKLRNSYEGENEFYYEKYLSEFIGIYTTLVYLGLEERWQIWQIKHQDE